MHEDKRKKKRERGIETLKCGIKSVLCDMHEMTTELRKRSSPSSDLHDKIVDFIVSHAVLSADLNPETVVELGCGTGAVGLGVSALGAQRVVLTDLEHLQELVESNISNNRETIRGHVIFKPFAWQDHSVCLKSLVGVENCVPDLLLASDVVYSKDEFVIDSLIDAIQRLANEKTKILISYEYRPAVPFPVNKFELAGFRVQEVPLNEQDPEWCSSDIHIYGMKYIVKV